MNTNKKTPLQIAIRLVIILVLIILLILLALGIVKVVPKAFTSLNNVRDSIAGLGNGTTTENTEDESVDGETINVVLEPNQIGKNDQVTVRWTRNGGGSRGFYTFEYGCQEGIAIERYENDPDNETFQPIRCDFTEKITDSALEADSFVIHAVNNSPIEQETIITISHKRKTLFGNVTLATGTTTLRIGAGDTEPVTDEDEQDEKPMQSPAPAPAKPATSPRPSNTTTYAGPADLAVNTTRILQAPDGRVNVQFQISNIGQRPSGAYRFRVFIPTTVSMNQIYDSAYQSSIPRGGTSYFNLGFYGLSEDNRNFIIVVDPTNQVNESNESNNESRSLITFTTK